MKWRSIRCKQVKGRKQEETSEEEAEKEKVGREVRKRKSRMRKRSRKMMIRRLTSRKRSNLVRKSMKRTMMRMNGGTRITKAGRNTMELTGRARRSRNGMTRALTEVKISRAEINKTARISNKRSIRSYEKDIAQKKSPY